MPSAKVQVPRNSIQARRTEGSNSKTKQRLGRHCFVLGFGFVSDFELRNSNLVGRQQVAEEGHLRVAAAGFAFDEFGDIALRFFLLGDFEVVSLL